MTSAFTEFATSKGKSSTKKSKKSVFGMGGALRKNHVENLVKTKIPF